MRYRKLDVNLDFTFGHGSDDFLVNSVEAVAQSVLTRLKLSTGEWFLDLDEGTPYATQVRGRVPKDVADQAVRSRVLVTLNVTSIESFSSTLVNRNYRATMDINTTFGQVQDFVVTL